MKDDVPPEGSARMVWALSLLRDDLRAGAPDWENTSLPSFLESFERLVDEYEEAFADGTDAGDPWRLLAELLLAARYYE